MSRLRIAPTLRLCAALTVAFATAAAQQGSIFEHSVRTAKDALAAGKLAEAEILVERALERDPKSTEAWALRARLGEAKADADLRVHALHRRLGLLIAQEAKKSEIAAAAAEIQSIDPIASDLFKLREGFVDRLQALADQYGKERRPHSAIRVLQEILALDPEHPTAALEIERISAQPDPSLADTARPKDLLADVSVDWIRKHDAEHAPWDKRAQLERTNYITHTNAGYEVLVRSAEAMEQMNAFYRRFFRYGDGVEDKRSVPRIQLWIFKNRDEYLKLGSNPPEWSGGIFTGWSVQTYIGAGGFEETVTTLFHEAAHQFVSLATSAAGWLNEGLASFFEGCRILGNGTVLMNMPANHRLFPLVARMEHGWMRDAADGIDPNGTAEPDKAPTFRIVLENEYEWGPPWYAPTWGVVYFLWNYQDPADGRFVYRDAFRTFIDASGGKSGKSAIETFEEVVLMNPQPPTAGLPKTAALKLPKKVDQLDETWAEWLKALAAEQSGQDVEPKPYLAWARFAIARNEVDVATEHFEKGLAQNARDPDLLLEFAEHLTEREHDSDRAVRLALDALRVLEAASLPDKKRIAAVESKLSRWDPKRSSLELIHAELWKKALAVAQRYFDAKQYLMAMEVSGRLALELNAPGMLQIFERAARAGQRSTQLWQLAYNEEDLGGWGGADRSVWSPYGAELRSRFGAFAEGADEYTFLTYDTVTSGDYSIEVEVKARRGENAFCGLVFGKKAAQTFHVVMLTPGREANVEAGDLARQDYVDLSSIYGGGAADVKIWRHNPVKEQKGGYHKLRLDVVGSEIDVWCDGELLVWHDFGSVDPLRGAFGLVTGRGSATWRNLRFLSRNPRDLAGRIEREIRREGVEKQSGGGAIGGSWLGKAPPFPKVARWLQGGRTSFTDMGAVPTLLVFWSIAQNELLPVDAWLRALAQQSEDIGLQVVAIAQAADGAKLEPYLAAHPFPGSVGVDKSPPTPGLGPTYVDYSIDRFQLPRLVLIDVDGKVAWEGDPGLAGGVKWRAGMPTYLDEPLAELATKRHLRDARRFATAWNDGGRAALEAGDFAAVAPLLKKARELDRTGSEVVDGARAFMDALDACLDDPPGVVADLAKDGAEPAVLALVEWAKLLGKPADVAVRGLGKALTADTVKDWQKALKLLEKPAKSLPAGAEWEALKKLREELKPLGGVLIAGLREDLARAAEARDLTKAKAILAGAAKRPAAYLVGYVAGRMQS